MNRLFIMFLYASVFVTSANAIDCHKLLDGINDRIYNPKPDADDIIIPMPCGGSMAFRKIYVPGSGFWGNEKRIVSLGNSADENIFEKSQNIAISGSFSDADENWYFVLGKYEITIAQYIIFRGTESLDRVIESDSPLLKGKKLSQKSLENELSKPLSKFDLVEYLTFIDSINRWLFEDNKNERLSNIPNYKNMPGFIRFPNEYEWEYAARGGMETIGKSFDDKLPYKASENAKYAWNYRPGKSLKIRPIGIKNPNPLMLHGMFGNVSEFVSGTFRPELWQGKPGGYIVKGGNIRSKGNNVTSSMRQENFYIKWDDVRPTLSIVDVTGARLSLGSLVTHKGFQKSELIAEYNDYLQDVRKKMPIGMTAQSSISQVSGKISQSQSDIDDLIVQLTSNSNAVSSLKKIKIRLEEAEDLAYKGTRDIINTLYKELILTSKDACEASILTETTINTLDNLNELLKSNPTVKLQKMRTKIEIKNKKVNEKFENYRIRFINNFKQLTTYQPNLIEEAMKYWETLFQSKGEKNNILIQSITTDLITDYQNRGVIDTNWFDSYQGTCKQLNI